MTPQQVTGVFTLLVVAFTIYESLDSYWSHEVKIQQRITAQKEVRSREKERRLWATLLTNAQKQIPEIYRFAQETQSDNIQQIAKNATGA